MRKLGGSSKKLEDHALILNDPTVIKEWRLDQVITSDLFGLSFGATPPDVEQALLQRRRASACRARHDFHSENEHESLRNLDRKGR